jgi:oxygen-independent coproporphyrinogen-3 oxidase
MNAGIYIHIPFCRAKCIYCDFFSVVEPENSQNRFVASLIHEIEIQAQTRWQERQFDTIYFGGGTPSVLKPTQIGVIIEALRKHFRVTADAEVTIEINPETVDAPFFAHVPEIGVNRVSIGIQSFNDSELRTIGRIHDAQTGLRAIEGARNSGIENFSLDLIFGIPGQNLKSWQETLAAAIAQNPAHISAYGLTIEKGTPLESMINSGKLNAVDEDIQLYMYRHLLETMARNGFNRYEISNFAQPGKESRHNLKYWRDNYYVGFGPSAHSYDGQTRTANVRDLARYENFLAQNQLPIDFCEQLTAEQKAMERLLMGIRLAEGVELANVISTIDENRMESLCDDGLVSVVNGMLIITEKGLPVSDKIIAQLLKL